MTDAGPIYPDKHVTFTRTLAMIDAHTIVGIDQITTTSGDNHTLDIAFHLPGEWNIPPNGDPWKSPAAKNGYPFITPATVRPANATGPTTLSVTNHNHPLSLTLLAAADNVPTQLITGVAVGESTDDHIPVALVRRSAQSTTYVWCIAIDHAPPKLTTLPAPAGSVTVKVGDTPPTLQITANPADHSVTVRK
jgi:hypothetical protein